MKTTKLYEIRNNGRSMSPKLRTYARARKLAARLRKMGRDVNLAAWNINKPEAPKAPAFTLGRDDIRLFF